MNRRKFLRSAAAALATLFLPKRGKAAEPRYDTIGGKWWLFEDRDPVRPLTDIEAATVIWDTVGERDVIVDGNAAVTEDAYVGRLLTETYERSDGHSIAYKWGYGMIQEYIDGMRVPLGTLKVRLGISIIPPGEDGCITMWIDPEGGTG